MIAWCNGQWIDDQAAALSIADRGFTLGDGLFETILWDQGRLHRFNRHVARLHSSAAALELPTPPSDLEQIARETLAKNDLTLARAAIRISWSAGAAPRGLLRASPAKPSLIVAAAPSEKPSAPARLITSAILRNETAPSSRHKTLSYIDNIMARMSAAEAGGDEALLYNTRSMLAGGASSNIFLSVDGRVLTPPIADGALPGTARAALLAEAPSIEERSLGASDIARAEAAAITNALVQIRPVASIDGRELRQDHKLIAALYSALG